MERYVRQYPDRILSERCEKVIDFKNARLVVEKLKNTAYEIRSKIYSYPRGFEIAAPQIGSKDRIIILQEGYNRNPEKIQTLVLINPQILLETDFFYNWEDCLSLKDMRGCVKRCNRITVRYQDLNCNFHEKTFQGNIACDIQHGVDHLDGNLFFTRQMKYFIPLNIYRPLKDKGLEYLNDYVIHNYESFDPEQDFSPTEMKKFGLIHPKQCRLVSS